MTSTRRLILAQLLGGIPLILGVTLVAFVLMSYFGPDLTYSLLGKNPTAEDIQQVRNLLGYDQAFWQRYLEYLRQLLSFDFGNSLAKDQPVSQLIAAGFPASLQLLLPGFILGNGLALWLAMTAARFRGGWQDKSIMAMAVVGMSISFLIIIIGFQLIFSSTYGLDWFPVRGWQVHDHNGQFSWLAYLNHVAVPTMALVFVSLGYNTRFYRAVLVEELSKEHILTARAFGHSEKRIAYRHMLKNALIPIITRILFSVPMVLVSGSLLLETYFGIPGIGLVTYDAIMSGDQPVLKAIIGLTAALFVLVLITAEILYRYLDPRIEA